MKFQTFISYDHNMKIIINLLLLAIILREETEKICMGYIGLNVMYHIVCIFIFKVVTTTIYIINIICKYVCLRLFAAGSQTVMSLTLVL